MLGVYLSIHPVRFCPKKCGLVCSCHTVYHSHHFIEWQWGAEAGDKEESAGAQLRHVGRAGGESDRYDSIKSCTHLYLDVSLL